MLEMLLLLVAVVVCSNYTATLDSKGDGVFLLHKNMRNASEKHVAIKALGLIEGAMTYGGMCSKHLTVFLAKTGSVYKILPNIITLKVGLCCIFGKLVYDNLSVDLRSK